MGKAWVLMHTSKTTEMEGYDLYGRQKACRISDSHGGGYEEFYLPGYNAV
jgi:hypothetical protein